MAIEIIPSGVNYIDAKGRRSGVVDVFNEGALDGGIKLSYFQMANPSIRSQGIPVLALQLVRKSWDAAKPFEMSFESVGGFNNEAPYTDKDGWHENPDYAEIRNRYIDAAVGLDKVLKAAGFTVKELQHRLADQYPCHRIEFSPPADKAGGWNVARVLRLLAEEGFIPRDIAREALKTVPDERAKLLESSELAAAYKMIAEANGVSVERLMAHLGGLTAGAQAAPAAALG